MHKMVLCRVRDFRNLGFDNHNADTSFLVRKAAVRKGRRDNETQTSQKSKEKKFEKMRTKLEQKGITILGAPMKEKMENQGEKIYEKLSQPRFNC